MHNFLAIPISEKESFLHSLERMWEPAETQAKASITPESVGKPDAAFISEASQSTTCRDVTLSAPHLQLISQNSQPTFVCY